ncbi:hypothetical protein IKL64_05160 [bacterium]|nr:hypothetical protein [bacterium]
MTLFAAPVGYGYSTAYAPATTFTSDRKINPHKDSVFIDPRTGELTTIKPGIYDPEKTEKKGKGGLIALGATIAAAALAFVFRGKIAKIPFVKNTVIPALRNTKAWALEKFRVLKNAPIVKTVTDGVKNGFEAVKKFAGNAWTTVKNFFKKAPATPTP